MRGKRGTGLVFDQTVAPCSSSRGSSHVGCCGGYGRIVKEAIASDVAWRGFMRIIPGGKIRTCGGV